MTPEQVVARLRAAGCVWAEDEAALLVAEAGSPAELREMVARRESGEPLELVVGWVEFLGRRLAVAPGVFVPRRRTELLAREAMARTASGSVALEMCCGVAPVAALLDGFGAEVHAADVSDVAVACARANAPHARVHRGDLFAALPAGLAGRVDVLAANAPYVPTDRIAVMPPEARDHEPAVALDGGPDGVALHRRLAAEGAPWLAAGGVMLIETSPDQALLTSQAMSTAGLATGVVVDEEVGGCVVVGVRTGAAGRG